MSSDARTDDQHVRLARRLSHVVEEFEGDIHRDPERARGNCRNESYRFVCALSEHDIVAELVSGFHFFNGVIFNGHTAALVGDTVYDWTARQFYPHDQPVPLIQPLHEWRQTWRNL